MLIDLANSVFRADFTVNFRVYKATAEASEDTLRCTSADTKILTLEIPEDLYAVHIAFQIAGGAAFGAAQNTDMLVKVRKNNENLAAYTVRTNTGAGTAPIFPIADNVIAVPNDVRTGDKFTIEITCPSATGAADVRNAANMVVQGTKI